MRYLLALIFPPLAVLACGKPFQAILSLPLTAFFYFPGALHALLVVSSKQADERALALLEATKIRNRELIEAMIRHSSAAPSGLAPAIESPSPGRPEGDGAGGAQGAFDRATDAMIAGAVAAKDGAVRAYRGLPEWAQPISWGLAGGSVLSVALAIFLLARG